MSGSLLQAAGYYAYKLSFQVSPIIMVGGIADKYLGDFGGILPIMVLTEAVNLVGNLLSGSPEVGIDDFFANYEPLPGSTLFKARYGDYPFANQVTAANSAMIDPLRLSMRMVCPVNKPGGYTSKLATLTTLKSAIDQHVQLGGYFTVATPSYIYQNLLLEDIINVDSPGDEKQTQVVWQWNFYSPLITQAQAAAAQSNQMAKLTSGLPTDGSTSGPGAVSGSSGAVSSLVPGGDTAAGSNVGSFAGTAPPIVSPLPASPLG